MSMRSLYACLTLLVFSVSPPWDQTFLNAVAVGVLRASVIVVGVNVSVISSIHRRAACRPACVGNGPRWSASQRLVCWKLVVHKDDSTARRQTRVASYMNMRSLANRGREPQERERERRRKDWKQRGQRQIHETKKVRGGGGGGWRRQRCWGLVLKDGTKGGEEGWRECEDRWREKWRMAGRWMNGAKRHHQSENQRAVMSRRASQCVHTQLCLTPLPGIYSAMFVCVEEWTLMGGQGGGQLREGEHNLNIWTC